MKPHITAAQADRLRTARATLDRFENQPKAPYVVRTYTLIAMAELDAEMGLSPSLD